MNKLCRHLHTYIHTIYLSIYRQIYSSHHCLSIPLSSNISVSNLSIYLSIYLSILHYSLLYNHLFNFVVGGCSDNIHYFHMCMRVTQQLVRSYLLNSHQLVLHFDYSPISCIMVLVALISLSCSHPNWLMNENANTISCAYFAFYFKSKFPCITHSAQKRCQREKWSVLSSDFY